MSISRYHGQTVEVTVIGCTNLKNLEWFTKQDPYVCIEYGGSRFRTETCTDGGINPTFQQTFSTSLIEGIQEMNLLVWNSNTFTAHQLIGSGKIQLHKLISKGVDNRSWAIYDKKNKSAGEVKLFLYCSSLNQSTDNINRPPQFFPSPSPNDVQIPHYMQQTQPIGTCCDSQFQYRTHPDPSLAAQTGFCLHHRPVRQNSYSAGYPSEHRHSPGPSHYPHDHPTGPYRSHY